MIAGREYVYNADSDLYYALETVPLNPSADIIEILATKAGANDGPDWHWIVMLANGKFAYIRAGCDYTGWG